MSLRDIMASDLSTIVGMTDDFGQAATLYDSTGTLSGSVNVMVGDQTEAPFESGASIEIRTNMRIMATRAAATAILSREIRRADYFVIASGADAGTWTVDDVASDLGGGVNCNCTRARSRDVGQKGHREQ